MRSRREAGDGEGGKDKVMKKAGKDKVGGEDEEGWDSGEGEEKSCRPCGIWRGVYKKPRIFVRGFLLFCLEKLFFVKSVFLFFRFVIRAGNVDQDGLADFRVKAELNLINAEVFDRAFEVDITAFNVNAGFFHGRSDVADGNRTVKLAGFGSLTDQHDFEALQFFRLLGSALEQSFVVSFQFRFLFFVKSQIFGSCAKGFFGRQQIVAGVTVLDVYLVTHSAQFVYMFQKNNFHLISP